MANTVEIDGRGALFIGVLNGDGEGCIKCESRLSPGLVLMYRSPTGALDPVCNECACSVARLGGRSQFFILEQLASTVSIVGSTLMLTRGLATSRPLWLHLVEAASRRWGWEIKEWEGGADGE